MRPIATIIPLLAAATAGRAEDDTGSSGGSNVVEIGLNRISIAQRISGGSFGLSKRATYVESLRNNITGGGYYADVTVGNPPQKQTLVLDTGSSDIWVLAYNADLCTSRSVQRENRDSCDLTYDPRDSSSYTLVGKNQFSIRYLDGTASTGDWFTDDFSIGGATLKSLQMGLATVTVRGTGIMGVGFSNHSSARQRYNNVIDLFYTQQIIQSRAYALWLNDRRADTGSILFGGLDTGKFIGALEVLPIINDVQTKSITTFTVTMNAMTVSTAANGTRTLTLPSAGLAALLDSGTTLSYLPDSVAREIFSFVGAYTYTDSTGSLTFIDCEYLRAPSPGISFSFIFAGKNITVPVQEMVLDVFTASTRLPRSIPFRDVCLFGIQSTGSFGTGTTRSELTGEAFALLGDTFLRSAYVVYDLSHAQIGIAQANWNGTSSNVVELKAADPGLPRVTGVASQTVGGTGGSKAGDVGGGGTVTVTATPSPTNAAVRLGGGSGFGVLGVVALSSACVVLGSVLFVV